MTVTTDQGPLSPKAVIAGLLAAGVFVLVVTGTQLPLLSDPRVGLTVFVALGMVMCALGGIGRVATKGQWSHPLAVLSYVLGAAILSVWAASVFRLPMPLLRSAKHALWVTAGLAGLKVVISVIHVWLSSSSPGTRPDAHRRTHRHELESGAEVPR